jgi:hypothetical protein
VSGRIRSFEKSNDLIGNRHVRLSPHSHTMTADIEYLCKLRTHKNCTNNTSILPGKFAQVACDLYSGGAWLKSWL